MSTYTFIFVNVRVHFQQFFIFASFSCDISRKSGIVFESLEVVTKQFISHGEARVRNGVQTNVRPVLDDLSRAAS